MTADTLKYGDVEFTIDATKYRWRQGQLYINEQLVPCAVYEPENGQTYATIAHDNRLTSKHAQKMVRMAKAAGTQTYARAVNDLIPLLVARVRRFNALKAPAEKTEVPK